MEIFHNTETEQKVLFRWISILRKIQPQGQRSQTHDAFPCMAATFTIVRIIFTDDIFHKLRACHVKIIMDKATLQNFVPFKFRECMLISAKFNIHENNIIYSTITIIAIALCSHWIQLVLDW